MNYTNNRLDSFFDQLLYTGKSLSNRFMRTNIIEKEDQFVFTIDLPDVKKEDLKVSLKEGNLTVAVNIARPLEEGATYIVKERMEGEFSRTYFVGDLVKLSDISAKLNNGVLTLTINKVKEEEKKEQFVDIE